MQMPKYNHNALKKRMVKYCQYQNCGKEFIGIPIQKYCEIHLDPHNRKRIRPICESPGVKNRIFKHFFSHGTLVEFICNLEGCGKKFLVEIIPKQFIYPKYCETHRSEFRRINFERLRKNNKYTTMQDRENPIHMIFQEKEAA